jgi:amidase
MRDYRKSSFLEKRTATEAPLDVSLASVPPVAGKAVPSIHVHSVPIICQNRQPIGITFISRPFEEDKLLKIGYAFEQHESQKVT